MDFASFYQTMTAGLCIVAILLNVVLLPFAIYLSKYALGSFKIIMIVFSLTNVAHIVLDVISLPRFYAFPGVMVMFSNGVSDASSAQLCIVLLCALFCVQLFNEFLHFLYRYILLCRPRQQWCLQTRNFAIFLTTTVPAFMIMQGYMVYRHPFPNPHITHLIEKDVLQTLNVSIDRINGISFLFWENAEEGGIRLIWMDLLEMAIFFVPNTLLIIGSFVCGLKIHLFIKSAESMSPATKEMHTTVFKMLVFQTLVPFFVLQIPGIILLIGPLFITLNRFQLDALMSYCLLCPLLEPLIVVYFLMRKRIWRLLRKRKIDIGASTSIKTVG